MTKKYLALLCVSITALSSAIPPINLFRPSDRPLMPEPVNECWAGQLSIGYEGALTTRGFRDDGDDLLQSRLCLTKDREKKTNVLHIFGSEQNGLAALKGFDSPTKPGQFSQLFSINDENGVQGLFRPCGKLSIPLNLLLSYRYYFDYGINLAFHLPVISMELKDVHWRLLNGKTTQEAQLTEGLIGHIRDVSGLKLDGWKRSGVGDLVVQATIMRDFEQRKPFLNNVRVQGRLGIDFPTGKRADEDRLLAIPFGNDGAWGVQFAGGIDLTFCYTLRAGIDAEFLYLFGNTRCRRLRSAEHQTDLLFLRKADMFKEHGLQQQFNIYIESCNFWRGLSAKVNYQLLKKNDDRIDVASDRIRSPITNDAENLRDWTAHSLIFMGRYELWKDFPEARVQPAILGWYKWGFNGKRAILAQTLGVQLSIAF